MATSLIIDSIASACRPSRQTLLAEIEARMAAGETVRDACAALGVALPSFYRWRAQARAHSGGGLDSREAIRETAKRLFLEEGFGVSMNRIAAVAGIARQTLFNRFGSKERLFREVIQSVFERMMHALLHIDVNHDLEEVLTTYARQYLDVAFDPEGIALHRLAIAEMRQFPDIAMLMSTLGISRAVPPLANHLRLRIAKGEIRDCDPELIAECFLGAVTGHSRHRAIMGTNSDDRARLEARLNVGVGIFLAALRPE